MIEVLAPGVLCTVQDTGRHGWQAKGIGVCGAMDVFAARVANALLANPESAPVLEITLGAAQFRVLRDGWCAIAGADLDARLDDASLPPCRVFRVLAGQELRFVRAQRGCRAVLAVRGGWLAEPAFGSVATDLRAGLGGLSGRALARGDRIGWRDVPGSWRGSVSVATRLANPSLAAQAPLGLVPGPALQMLSDDDRALLFSAAFTVSKDSDRMGLRLQESLPSAATLPQQISSALVFAAMQLPPDGCPILVGADRQTTGGYPVAGVVAGIDHWRIAQARPGDTLRFRPVEASEARRAWQLRERSLARLGVAVQGAWQAE
ncbi:MAG: biotin-dependent carboxyltransferase family protein [Gammaproteobacteria bacterium]